jgi:hypothetical protein
MNLKISLLMIVVLTWPLCAGAQTARNPLNHEPARVTLQKGISSWKISEEIFYLADDAPFEKRSFRYDENGRKTSELKFRLNKVTQAWDNTSTSEYLYESGKEIVMNRSGRQYTSKTETISGQDGKPLYSYTWSWNRDADDWSPNPYLKSGWVYNGNGRVTTLLKQHNNMYGQVMPYPNAHDMATGEWNDCDARILYTYNETGALTEEVYQSWNAEQGLWDNKGRYTYSSDKERQKEAISYIYASGNWVFDGKTVYTYDEEGKIVRCAYFKNNTDNAPNAYSIIAYSEIAQPPREIEAKEIQVFPNPAVSFFELTVPDEYVGKTVQLFDTFGNQVKSLPVTGQRTQVDVNSLKSGVYMLKIGELSKKIIVQ